MEGKARKLKPLPRPGTVHAGGLRDFTSGLQEAGHEYPEPTALTSPQGVALCAISEIPGETGLSNPTFSLSVLVIHYNNPTALKRTVERMLVLGLPSDGIHILDNGSSNVQYEAALSICSPLGLACIRNDSNMGWGAAINGFLESRTWADADLMMVSAHDAWIETMDAEAILQEFTDARVAFVCPQYPNPLLCEFSVARSFRCRPVDRAPRREVTIAHATVCVLRPAIVARLKYDEEYFIYGCESEIFLRCARYGFKTMLLGDFVVVNPSTDSSSDFATVR